MSALKFQKLHVAFHTSQDTTKLGLVIKAFNCFLMFNTKASVILERRVKYLSMLDDANTWCGATSTGSNQKVLHPLRSTILIYPLFSEHLLPPLLHAKNLHHPDEDVDEVQF